MKLHITVSKYHSWYLCQISLQIMLLPIHIFSILATIIGDLEKRWPFEGVKRGREKIWGRLSIRWAMAFPFFCLLTPFDALLLYYLHIRIVPPQNAHQTIKERRLGKCCSTLLCTHQQSVLLSVDQPVKTNHWHCFGYLQILTPCLWYNVQLKPLTIEEWLFIRVNSYNPLRKC